MSDQAPTPIRQQHGTLRFLNDHDRLYESLQAALHADDVEEARQAVESMRRLLGGHMIVEEGPGGVFDAMEQANPELGPSLSRLRDDHRRLRAMLLALVEMQGKAGELEAIQAFAELLEVHELRERAALEAAARGPSAP